MRYRVTVGRNRARTLQGHKGQRQRWAAAEEKRQGEEETLADADIRSGSRLVEIGKTPVPGLLITAVIDLAEQTRPVGRVLVDLLATNLQFDLLDKLLGRVEGCRGVLGEGHLEETGVEQIPIAGNRHGDTLIEADRATERGLDRLKSKRRVPAKDNERRE